MRSYIFGYEQATAIKLGLGVRELLILDYIQNFINSNCMRRKEDSGTCYYLVVYKKLLSDLPILGIQERQLRNILHGLAEKKVISISGESAYYLYININNLLLCWKNISGTCKELPQYNKLNYIKIKYKDNITKRVQPSDKKRFFELLKKEIEAHSTNVTFDLWFRSEDSFRLEHLDKEGITFFTKNEKAFKLHRPRFDKAFDIAIEKYARGEVL